MPQRSKPDSAASARQELQHSSRLNARSDDRRQQGTRAPNVRDLAAVGKATKPQAAIPNPKRAPVKTHSAKADIALEAALNASRRIVKKR